MPTPLNDFDILELKVFCFGQNQLAVNVMHFEVQSHTGTPTLGALATTFDALIGPLYVQWLSAAAEYRGITLGVVAPSVVAPEIRNANAGVGTVAGDMMPTQVAGVVSFRTATVGREGRGRVYLPFFGESANSLLGRVTGTALTLMDNFAAAVTPDIVDAQGGGDDVTIHMCILHRATMTSTLVNGYLVREKWGTQRKRGAWGKENVVPF